MSQVPYADDPEWRALLAAVCARPADDLPRLVAADWLEEHGELVRAEFIRLQCESSHLDDMRWESEGRDTADIRALDRRAKQLLSGPGNDWAPAWLWLGEVVIELIPDGARFFDHLKFRRGFVSEVCTPMTSWMRLGAKVVRAHPTQTVEISDRSPGRELPDGTMSSKCRWYRRQKLVEPVGDHVLPGEIFDALRYRKRTPPHEPVEYGCDTNACDALLRACLQWARTSSPVEKTKLKWWGVSFGT